MYSSSGGEVRVELRAVLSCASLGPLVLEEVESSLSLNRSKSRKGEVVGGGAGPAGTDMVTFWSQGQGL